MKYLQLLLLICAISISGFSQIKEGHLVLEITEATTTSPEMEQAVGMMKATTQEIYFTPKRQKTVVNSMGGMVLVQTFVDESTKVPEQYMDMMGQKIKLVLSEEDMKQAEAASAGIEITYDKSDRMKILDFDCYKATFTVDAGVQKLDFGMYITEDIKMKQLDFQNLKNIKLNGTPMRVDMDMGMMKLVFEATSFDKSIDPSVFTKPEGTYQEMNLADLQKLGMGGLGF